MCQPNYGGFEQEKKYKLWRRNWYTSWGQGVAASTSSGSLSYCTFGAAPFDASPTSSGAVSTGDGTMGTIGTDMVPSNAPWDDLKCL